MSKPLPPPPPPHRIISDALRLRDWLALAGAIAVVAFLYWISKGD